ncbi:hypothetical protein AMTR_s00026p00069480 [Amborella trichopoda]|uniref:Uncharacterized protein n=1 Tax=Amborella trichopoda TaxID=13333 RepID=W1PR95_AMBTC|nr:hypothetical protein AMTR_s00026p00069480 [Amborella trichopoda]
MTINDSSEIWSEFFLDTWLGYFPEGHTKENTNISINIQFKEEAYMKGRPESIGRTRVGEEPLWLHDCAIYTSFDELQTIDDLGRIMSNRFRDTRVQVLPRRHNAAASESYLGGIRGHYARSSAPYKRK